MKFSSGMWGMALGIGAFFSINLTILFYLRFVEYTALDAACTINPNYSCLQSSNTALGAAGILGIFALIAWALTGFCFARTIHGESETS